MATKYSTSVNIIRDSERDLNYLITPNTTRLINQLEEDLINGLRSFNIIGSYGTGKSSFLWAFQQSATNTKKIFNLNFVENNRVEFINIVGEFKSLKQTFAELFNLKKQIDLSENIFLEIFNRYQAISKKSAVLFLVIDEFGKFLEYASQNNSEEEIYFIQQLAEFINNPDRNIILFTSVHQNFEAYAFSLTQTQKNEWAKVKGRLKEITFNEPVEHLLFLAATHIVRSKEIVTFKKAIEKNNDLLLRSKAFPINKKYIETVSQNLFPLDSISAYILTISMQRYGQNERSLFSFLESKDYTAIDKHKIAEDGFYSVANIYDYLIFDFYSFLNTKYNPDFGAWKAIRSALEKVENTFEKDIDSFSKLVKTIGLLSITAQSGSCLDKSFIVDYAENSLQIKSASRLIDELVSKKIIIYRNYSSRYVPFEGTDLDIPTALFDAGKKVDDITDVVTLLNRYFNLAPVIAKQSLYQTGTPRLFEYKISDTPIVETPEGEIDGFINLIFTEKNITENIIEASLSGEAILYCYYNKSKAIKELLFEIEKTKKVIEENIEDIVAVRELQNILVHQKNLLSHKILNNFTSKQNEIFWFFNGNRIEIRNKKELNKKLSDICLHIYNKTPWFNNELVNKHKISPSIHTAKRNYFKALVNSWDKPQLGFPIGKYPPEKTIYLSLLESNNIILYTNQISSGYYPSSDNQFDFLWELSTQFLESAKFSKVSVSKFSELLTMKPFKLKQGVIDFWLPTFLFIKRDDFALFSEDGYIPAINEQTLELLAKNPEEYKIKTYSIEGVKLDIYNSYRMLINQQSKEKITTTNIIETIKPYLTFYRDLPNYSKKTLRIGKDAISLRNAISNSKDPEQTFFEDFPLALGFNLNQLKESPSALQEYIVKLRDAIRDLRTCYDELLNRIELFIQNDIIGETVSFEEYKRMLQIRFKNLKKHLLLPNQSKFVDRLDSELNDRNLWLNSIVFPFINISLQNIKSDEDELIIYDRFKEMIIELDSLTKLSLSDFQEEKEDVYDLQINTFIEGISKKLIRLPKNKKVEVAKIQANINTFLGKDKSLNIAALANILKDLLK